MYIEHGHYHHTNWDTRWMQSSHLPVTDYQYSTQICKATSCGSSLQYFCSLLPIHLLSPRYTSLTYLIFPTFSAYQRFDDAKGRPSSCLLLYTDDRKLLSGTARRSLHWSWRIQEETFYHCHKRVLARLIRYRHRMQFTVVVVRYHQQSFIFFWWFSFIKEVTSNTGNLRFTHRRYIASQNPFPSPWSEAN